MESSYKLQVFSLLDKMTATISWQWMSLLVNRGNCALKFWVIEFVKVIVLPCNAICRFRAVCNLQKGRTTMKLPPSPHLPHADTDADTQTQTHSASLTQFPISHCSWFLPQRKPSCATRNLRWYFFLRRHCGNAPHTLADYSNVSMTWPVRI